MLLLGIDIGTSSIKVSIVDADTQQSIASTIYPEVETEIISIKPGWAEQDPEVWWHNVQQAILKLHNSGTYQASNIVAIGIAYQMHGLVMVDGNQNVLRNSIIWCDSRSIDIGKTAFEKIGSQKCVTHLLNSPGNFTASKLAWVKHNEPEVYAKAHKIMLPGDFIAMKLTGEITTSIAALSEGIFWDFKNNQLSKDIFDYYGFDTALIPTIKNVFEEHGKLTKLIAEKLCLPVGIPVTYKAGDQPNNAFSLNVLQPGQVAANAGTSGVIYAVNNVLAYDKQLRVNSFAHVNYLASTYGSNNKTVSNNIVNMGILLCINGTGILNRWIKNIASKALTYQQINEAASKISIGSNGLQIFPFGNGAERMLGNKIIGACIQNIDLNIHTNAHLFRAAQEGIAFAFRYGMDIMKENGLQPNIIRAGKSNMFLSSVFTKSFVNVLNMPVQLYNVDGSVGAAIGAGLGAKVYKNEQEAFQYFKPIITIEPAQITMYDELYLNWKNKLESQ